MPEGILYPANTNLRNKRLLLFLASLFVLVNAVLSYFGIWYMNLLPILLLALFVVLFSLEWAFFLVIFFTPLSLQLKEFIPGLGFDLHLPTEPLLVLILILFIIKLLRDHKNYFFVFRHPVSMAVIIYLAWLMVTSISSSLPLVSIKFFLTRLWFIVGFYFLAILIFTNRSRITSYILYYASGMLIVVGYAYWNQFQGGFMDHQTAHSAAHPFFNDHTSYGAVLALLLPVLIALSFSKELPKKLRFFLSLLCLLFFIAFIFSYSRAAWLSLLAAGGIFLVVKLKIPASYILLISILSVVILIFSWPTIEMRLEKNRQESSASLSQHVQSISNISSDASNLERINRWKSALRMFRERPVLGWGPGTYMFQYAAFQSSHEKTIISTNFGDRGNAHSEYIGAMAESGLPGMLSYLLILILGLYTGFRNYSYKSRSLDNNILLAVCLGLITYTFHGFLNNFLDTDKASALFWGYLGLIVVVDLKKNILKT